ncbi:hypothetical protein ACWGI9_29655 [Streptomyces sp. NPDC054833]
MTTATTVAGRTLSGWSRDARHGTWHALLPAKSGEPPLGALRIDRALLAPEGTRERLASAVLAVARLRLPGVLGTVDLVAEAGEVWLITARPPAPTLADLLAGGGPDLDAGSAASVLNETAQTLLALHAAGLAHGALDTDTVVLAPDGVALLAGAAPGAVLGDAPDRARREADIAAWAGLCRTLGEAWAPGGTPAAALFAHCSTTAAAEGLAAARAALVAGRAALPADFLRRTALRAAVAAAAPEITEAPSAAGTGSDDGGADSDPAPTASKPVAPEADDRATPDDQLTILTRSRSRSRSHSRSVPDQAHPTAAPDDQATVLGRRNRVPAESPAAVPPPPSEDDGEILLRFGPGIPVEAQDALRAQWGTPLVPPDTDSRQRRRRRGWIATTAVLTIAAVLLWLLLRPSPAPTVTAVEVQAPAGRLHCGQTADLVGVVTTDGRGGPVTYHWLRSDGHDSGELVHMAHRGDPRVTVHLRWTVRGPGSFRGTARLRIAHQRKPVEAQATFSYACS